MKEPFEAQAEADTPDTGAPVVRGGVLTEQESIELDKDIRDARRIVRNATNREPADALTAAVFKEIRGKRSLRALHSAYQGPEIQE